MDFALIGFMLFNMVNFLPVEIIFYVVLRSSMSMNETLIGISVTLYKSILMTKLSGVVFRTTIHLARFAT